MKSDFEILMDLRKEVSRLTAFLVLVSFVNMAMAFMWAGLGDRVLKLEASIAELKGEIDDQRRI